MLLPFRAQTSRTSALVPAVLVLAVLLGACTESDAPTPAPTPTPTPDTAATANMAPTRTGAEIVNQHCLVCHGRGLYNAPKIGDAEAWRPKLAEGREHLWQVVLHGEKAMPPRGNCHDCSDAELRAAMDYLLAQALPAAAEPAAATVPPATP